MKPDMNSRWYQLRAFGALRAALRAVRGASRLRDAALAALRETYCSSTARI
jgi:hypothetical protein